MRTWRRAKIAVTGFRKKYQNTKFVAAFGLHGKSAGDRATLTTAYADFLSRPKMLDLIGKGKAHTCDGATRRDFLQVGTLGGDRLGIAAVAAGQGRRFSGPVEG